MIRRVTGRCDHDHDAVCGQALAGRERPESLGRKIERFGIEPSRPAVGKIAANLAGPTARRVQLAARDENFSVGKMCKAAVVVIHVQMRQHNPFHIGRGDPQGAKLRSNLLFTLDLEGHLPSNLGMQGDAHFEQVCAMPGVDHDDAIAMLDRPRIGRQPIGPVAIGEDGEPPRQAVATAFDLRRLDPNEAGLNSVNVSKLVPVRGFAI
jgi:hypothetical protein